MWAEFTHRPVRATYKTTKNKAVSAATETAFCVTLSHALQKALDRI